MGHSNSSLNCFAACMAKYEHQYIKHTTPDGPPSPHLLFGIMAHDVLCKAGALRDEVLDGVVSRDEYDAVIPSEILYSDLKDFFAISSWRNYFTPVIKYIATEEERLVKELREDYPDEEVQVERELKVQYTVDQLHAIGVHNVEQPLTGVLDLLIRTKNRAIILDYKFSANRKTQDDFDMNSQLPFYAFFVSHLYGVPIHNIKVGYIDIPKQEFGKPTLLSNGTLSRAKSQNTSADMYERAVIAIHGDDFYYNCGVGGYYYDCYCALQTNKPAYLNLQYIDEDMYDGVTKDLLNAAAMVDFMKAHDLPFLKKYDSYTCKGCDFVTSCKPWLKVNSKEV